MTETTLKCGFACLWLQQKWREMALCSAVSFPPKVRHPTTPMQTPVTGDLRLPMTTCTIVCTDIMNHNSSILRYSKDKEKQAKTMERIHKKKFWVSHWMLALTTIFVLFIRNTELYKQYVCGNLICTVMLIVLGLKHMYSRDIKTFS